MASIEMVMSRSSEGLIRDIRNLEIALNKLIESDSKEWNKDLFPRIPSDTILGEMLTRIVYWIYYKSVLKKCVKKYCKMGLDLIMVLLDSVYLSNSECFFHVDTEYWVDIIKQNKNPKVYTEVINYNDCTTYMYTIISIITKLIKDTLTHKYININNTKISYKWDKTFDKEISELRKRKVYTDTDTVDIYLHSRHMLEIFKVPEVIKVPVVIEDSIKQKDNQSCVTESEDNQSCVTESEDNQSCVTEQEDNQSCVIEQEDNQSCVIEQEDNQSCVTESEDNQSCVTEQEDNQSCVTEQEVSKKIKVPILVSYSEGDAISDISTLVTRENGKIKISITYV